MDDYLTKPFKEDDLLAVVEGKLKRASLIEQALTQISKIDLGVNEIQFNAEDNEQIILFLMKWSEDYGARLQSSYPKDLADLSIQNIGQRFMQTAMSLRTNKKQSE